MNSQTELPTLDAIVSNPTVSNKIKSRASLTTYRLMILYRFILAIFGGYILSTLVAIVTAQVFADYRASAVMTATLLAFTVHCCAFIWVFMVNKTLKASLGIIIPSIVLFIISQVLGK